MSGHALGNRQRAIESLEVCAICGGELAGEPWQASLDGEPVHLACLPRFKDEPETGPDDKAEEGW